MYTVSNKPRLESGIPDQNFCLSST